MLKIQNMEKTKVQVNEQIVITISENLETTPYIYNIKYSIN